MITMAPVAAMVLVLVAVVVMFGMSDVPVLLHLLGGVLDHRLLAFHDAPFRLTAVLLGRVIRIPRLLPYPPTHSGSTDGQSHPITWKPQRSATTGILPRGSCPEYGLDASLRASEPQPNGHRSRCSQHGIPPTEPATEGTPMSFRNRTVTVMTGATVATALAGAAAFAAVDTPTTHATMAHMPAHMAELDATAMAEMHSLMAEGASVGEMHRWMRGEDMDIGQMHHDRTSRKRTS